MVNGPAMSHVSVLATEVSEVLGSMHGYLDAAMNPDRLALRHLGVDRMGWTQAAHNEEALGEWSKQLRRRADDFRTIHHLAIGHQARAMDREAGRNPRESDEDWKAAMEYWRQLHTNEGFWDYIAGIACRGGKRDAVEELRQKLPELLLQIHYDIAFDAGTKKHRAKYHIKMVQEAPFPEVCKEAVRRETYSRFIKGVRDDVWQLEMLDPEIIKEGTDVIERYLELDPGCVAALEDALRLQVRVLRARHQDLKACGPDSSQRETLLKLFKRDADYWKEYFALLVAEAGKLEDDIRHKLSLWYRVMGEVHRALDKHEDAIVLYEKGVAVGVEDDDQRQQCVRELGDTLAYVARERAHEGVSGAKEYCDRVRARRDLSVSAHFFLANAYTLLGEFDVAEETCRRGMAMKPEITDFNAMERHEKDRERLAEMLKNIGEARRRHRAEELMGLAAEDLKRGRHEEALAHLNEAIGLTPQAPAHFLRCQCRLALTRPEEARADLDSFRRLVADSEAQAAEEVIRRLQKECDELARQAAEFGVEALTYRRLAAEAFEIPDMERGLSMVRKAAEACTNVAWKKELAKLVNAAAVRIHEPAAELTEPFARAAQNVMREVSAEIDRT